MSVSNDFLAYVIEQLGPIPRVTSRRMFGGVGIYADGVFFAIIDDDVLYLKVDDSNRADYERRGMGPFCPVPDEPEKAMGYFSIPADVLEEPEELARWARKSVQVALAAKRAPARRPGRRGTKKRA